MFELITGITAGIIVAFLCMWFYRRGVKDGMSTSKGEKPEPIISPKDNEDEEETIASKAEKIIAYDPYGEKV